MCSCYWVPNRQTKIKGHGVYEQSASTKIVTLIVQGNEIWNRIKLNNRRKIFTRDKGNTTPKQTHDQAINYLLH